uniref:Uncharacterized protein n=1 Tax=viral metagenome TaxID=1070528 RepID=A0A6M3K0H6_9ZZZZ
MADKMKEICKNCGLTFGSHLSTGYYSYFYKAEYPTNYCPGHEGRMDWDKGPGTVFIRSGKYKEDPNVSSR